MKAHKILKALKRLVRDLEKEEAELYNGDYFIHERTGRRFMLKSNIYKTEMIEQK